MGLFSCCFRSRTTDDVDAQPQPRARANATAKQIGKQGATSVVNTNAEKRLIDSYGLSAGALQEDLGTVTTFKPHPAGIDEVDVVVVHRVKGVDDLTPVSTRRINVRDDSSVHSEPAYKSSAYIWPNTVTGQPRKLSADGTTPLRTRIAASNNDYGVGSQANIGGAENASC